MTEDKDILKRIVKHMVESAQMSGGYVVSISNCIPWNVPSESVKIYLDFAAEIIKR